MRPVELQQEEFLFNVMGTKSLLSPVESIPGIVTGFIGHKKAFSRGVWRQDKQRDGETEEFAIGSRPRLAAMPRPGAVAIPHPFTRRVSCLTSTSVE